LNSIFSSDIIDNIQVFVIDNDSSDKTVSIVKTNYPEVNVLIMEKNIGFGAAHNQILNKIRSIYHIFVNPDIMFSNDVIKKIKDFFDINVNKVIVTPKILNDDMTEQFVPQEVPKLKYIFGGRLERFGKLFKKWRQEYTGEKRNRSMSYNINFASGCFLPIRTSVLQKIGGFDPRYFLYFEDADMSRQALKYGEIIYNPEIEIIHEWKRNNRHSIKGQIIFLVSYIKYKKKWKNFK